MNAIVRKVGYNVLRLRAKCENRTCRFEMGSQVAYQARFEGNNKISANSFFSGEIGFASYIGKNSVVIGKVGRFSSIAENVTFLTKTHPTDTFISTHPCFYSLKKQSGFSFVNKQLFDEEPLLDDSKYSIVVGNDVYIGFGATIIGPCKIGNGAIIAAGAVVTDNIPDFAIVGRLSEN